jgi:hypothetical protein
MTDKERIKMVVDWKKLTPNAFAKKIGYAKGKTIYDFINGTRPLNFKVAAKIVETFPEISKSWILTGEGGMFIEKSQPMDSEIIENEIDITDISYSKEEYLKILKQNKELKNQVTELLRMQYINSESINYLVTKNRNNKVE